MELREKWRKSIEEVDETFLKMIDTMYANYVSEPPADYFTDEIKALLDKRLDHHKANPESGISFKELKKEFKAKYGV